jgi:hypothetical protein
MNSDDWNTVYVSHIDNDIAVYYGPFANKLSKTVTDVTFYMVTAVMYLGKFMVLFSK